MDIQLKKGLLELCVLAVLKKEDSYGYQIIKDINDYIEISESTLYPILKRLKLNDNLTTYSKEYNGRLRKYYKITEKGKKRLLDCQEDFKQIKSIYEFILGGNDNE